MWEDPPHRRGPVRYNGKTVFDTREEAQRALDYDRKAELKHDPNSKMEWEIVSLPARTSR